MNDPVMSGIRAFQAVDNQFRAGREEKRAIEDRALRMEDRERRIAQEDELMSRQRLEWGRSDKQFEDQQQAKYLNSLRMTLEQGEEGLLALPEDDQQRVLSMAMQDPRFSSLESIAEQRKAMADLDEGIRTGDKERGIQGFNALFSDVLNRGLADDGQPAKKKEVVNVYATKDGDFYAELLVTRQDGTQYKAPLTVGQDANPHARVNALKAEKVGAHLKNRKALMNFIEAKLVGLGDDGPLKEAITKRTNERLASALQGAKSHADAILIGVREGNPEVADSFGKVAHPAAIPQKWHATAGGEVLYEEGSGNTKRTGWVKQGEGSGTGKEGSAGGKGYKIPANSYTVFENQLKNHFLQEAQTLMTPEEIDEAEKAAKIGNFEKIDIRNILARNPELLGRFNKAFKHGELLMGDNGRAPGDAAGLSYTYSKQPAAVAPVKQPSGYASISVTDKARVDSLDRYLSTKKNVEDFYAEIQEIGRTNPDLANELMARRKGKAAKDNQPATYGRGSKPL